MKSTVNIRVIHFIGGGEIGGRERILHLLLREEKRSVNVRSAVLFLKPSGPFYDEIVRDGLERIDISNGRSVWNAVKQCARADVLVFHTAHWKLMVIGLASGAPIVYRLSGLYLTLRKSLRQAIVALVRRKRVAGDTDGKVTGLYSGRPNSRSAVRLIRRWLFQLFLRKFVRMMVVNSRYALQGLRKEYGLDPRRPPVRIIPNGLPLETASGNGDIRQQLGLPSDTFLIGTVARFDVRKRIDRLLEAFAALSNSGSIHLVIVGGGDRELGMRYENFVQGECLSHRVTFVGFRNDIGDWLSAMNLFVLPSDNESCPNALLEAMLFQKPVVVYEDSGGPVEIIRNGENGIVIAGPSDFQRVVDKVRLDPSWAQDLGARAHAYVVNHYSLATYQQRYAKLYRDLVAPDRTETAN